MGLNAKPQQIWRLKMLALHLVMILAPVCLLAYPDFHLPSGCMWKAFTGVECPACGITHAVGMIETGHLRESFGHHPAGLPVLMLLVLLVGYLIWALLFDYDARVTWGKEVRAYSLCDRGVVLVLLSGWFIKIVS